MEAMENILTRRSVRIYRDTPVSRETLDTILAAAQMAPSWKNTQTSGYIVITTPEMKAALMEALPPYNAKTVSTAPVVVVMTTRKKRCAYERDGSFSTKKEDRWEMFDAGIACQTLCLAAWAQGPLCWTCRKINTSLPLCPWAIPPRVPRHPSVSHWGKRFAIFDSYTQCRS